MVRGGGHSRGTVRAGKGGASGDLGTKGYPPGPMPRTVTPAATDPSRRPAPAVREVPCLMVRKGTIAVPGEDGPTLLRDASGSPVDVFDAFDRLSGDRRRVYAVDLDGIEHDHPALDLWPELAREADLWIDAGVPTADQAIDILVSGARRAVLSTRRLRGPTELQRAWGLSQDLAFEIETAAGKVPHGAWKGRPVDEVAAEVRNGGPTILVISPREEPVDWNLIARIAAGGPTWVAGTYEFGNLRRLEAAGARGGIYHPDPRRLADPSAGPPAPASEE